MECRAEHPTGDLSTPRLSIFDVGSFHHALRKWDVFPTRQRVGFPPDVTRVTKSVDPRMGHGHRGTEREPREINFGRENLVVTSIEVF